MMSGFDSTTAKSSMRPPITAGPISRNLMDLNVSLLSAAVAQTAMRNTIAHVVTFFIAREMYQNRGEGCPCSRRLVDRMPQLDDEEPQQKEDAEGQGDDEEYGWAAGTGRLAPDPSFPSGHWRIVRGERASRPQSVGILPGDLVAQTLLSVQHWQECRCHTLQSRPSAKRCAERIVLCP